MADLILLEKDLGYTEKKLEELEVDFKSRQPASKTQDFITEVKVTMKGQTDKLDNIVKTLDCHIKDQKEHERDIAGKLDTSNILLDDRFSKTQKTMLDFINSADSKYTDKEQFIFWRNVLITGIILTIAIGFIINILIK